MSRCDVDQSRRAFLGLAASVAALSFSSALDRACAQSAASGAAMKIGVIGSGRLGGTVGGLWAKAGHQVLFSSRHPEELKPLAEGLGPNARTGTVAEAVAFGDVLLIAVPYAALPEIGRDNARGLAGKIVLDACNPIIASDGEMAKAAQEKGVGAASAEYLPGTRLVRAFNSFGSATFAREAHRAGEPIGVPIAGDDAEALKVAAKLVRDAGFEPVVVPLARAKEFAPPAPLFTKALPVSQLKQQLGVAQ
jgi:8-hydroxy-5-deazaflavin:NADPH oxidoreductase